MNNLGRIGVKKTWGSSTTGARRRSEVESKKGNVEEEDWREPAMVVVYMMDARGGLELQGRDSEEGVQRKTPRRGKWNGKVISKLKAS